MTAPETDPPGLNGPWACIDRQAIAHNLAWAHARLRSHAAPWGRPRLWAVVKADAYGHGLQHALAALRTADGLAVACLEDAFQLRGHGWRGPVLLLSACGIDPAGLSDPALGELHVAVDDAAALDRLERLRGRHAHVHAWLRYAGHLRSHGFDDADYAGAFQRLHALARSGALAGAGHLHHYAASEDPRALVHERQAFAAATAGLPGPHCTGNSAALCGDTPLPMSGPGHWLRSGLLLYGASALPGRTGAELGLRPAMSLRARLQAIRRVPAGQTIGYGNDFRTQRDTCIGVVGAGYGHGLPRRLWQDGSLLVGRQGRRVPLAGRVAMDCLTVDLGPQPPERPGDVVTLWGRSANGEALPVETVARSCDTIAADLLTGLTARVPLIAQDGSRHPETEPQARAMRDAL